MHFSFYTDISRQNCRITLQEITSSEGNAPPSPISAWEKTNTTYIGQVFPWCTPTKVQSSRDLTSWKYIVFNNCSWTLPPWKCLFELIYNFGLHIIPSNDFHNSTGWKIRALVELIFKPDNLTGCPSLFGLYSPSPHCWGFYVSSWPSATSLPSWRLTAYTWKLFHSSLSFLLFVVPVLLHISEHEDD